MGLNWSPMAHAAGERRGYHGHAAFNVDVFWGSAPDIVVPRLFDDQPQHSDDLIVLGVRTVLRNIFDSERFRAEYVPGYITRGEQSLTGFFRRTWMERAGFEGLQELPWQAPD